MPAAINGMAVASVTDATYASGMIGFGTSGYQTDQFDNLSVTLAGSVTPTGHIIAGDDTAECADVNGGSAADGTKVQMWGCNSNAAAQSWTMESNGTVGINGKCLDITGGSTANGALIEEWTCDAGHPARPLGPATEAATSSGRCPDRHPGGPGLTRAAR